MTHQHSNPSTDLSAGVERALTPVERRLWRALRSVPAGQPVTQETLVRRTWGSNVPLDEDSAHMLRVNVSRLRRKVGAGTISTLPSVGYCCRLATD